MRTSGEVRAILAGMSELSLEQREQVAGQVRHWVRLTRRCNNRCLFCLDAPVQDGSLVPMEEITADLEAGRKRGAGRVVLSGGEPTIHPEFVGIVALAKRLGYEWVQVVSNGRMFAYRSFLDDCVRAGLDEVTFSMPAADAKMFTYLTGTPVAFEQSLTGLRRALAVAGLVVSVDVVVSKVNLAELPQIVEFYLDLGVSEFDLLQVVPFGRAFEHRQDLLFDRDQRAAAAVRRAVSLAEKRGAVVWTNRMEPVLLEGLEHYIQDPHKIADEVFGRRSHLAAVAAGGSMPCRDPERCPHCFLEGYCRHLERVRGGLAGGEPLWLRFGVDDLDRLHRLTTRASLQGLWFSPASGTSTDRFGRALSRARALWEGPWILSLDPGLDMDALGPALSGMHLEQIRVSGPLSSQRLSAVIGLMDQVSRSGAGASDPMLVLALGQVDLAALFEAWPRDAGLSVRLGWPDVGTVAELGRLAFDPVEQLAWLRDRGGDPVRLTFEDVPPCLPGVRGRSAPGRISGGPSWVSAESLDEQGVIRVEPLVEDFVRQSYRVWSSRCEGCPARESCPGLPIQVARKFGLGIVEPWAISR